jgi:MFS family permease
MQTSEIARGKAVWALAVGQMLGYACLFYIFSALIVAWQDDLGWEKTRLAAGPTLAIIVSAICAPFLGRLVDRGWADALLSGGALLGAVALVWISQVTTQAGWLAGWVVIGIAQAACLYEVCFSFLIRRLGPDARTAIIRVTLVAGFASTLAFPAGAALAEMLGWRAAVWVAAAVAALVIAPLNYWGARSIQNKGPAFAPTTAEADRAGLRLALVNPGFWLLAVAFALLSLNHWMIVNFLVPVFMGLGMAHGAAVLAASLVGPAQVAGRLVLMRYENRIGTGAATMLTIGVSLVATLCLWAAGLGTGLIFAYAILQGAAMGIVTILRPVMISEVLGQAGYGAIAGVIQIPSLLAGALAPILGAAILAGPGSPALLGLSVVLSLCAMAAVTVLRRLP